MALTKGQKKAYLKHDTLCPYCGSENIDAGHFENTDDGGWQNVWCHDCGKRWEDHYKLVDIVEEEEQINELDG